MSGYDTTVTQIVTGVPVPLPGLSLEEMGPSGHSDALVEKVKMTLTALSDQNLLTERHAGIAQLCLDLAAAVGVGIVRGRASAVAMVARELREALAMLPEPEEGVEGYDEFDQLAAELREAALQHGARPARA